MSESLAWTAPVDRAAMTERFLTELFDHHHERLYRIARRMSRDPEAARDLVQETFLKAAQRADRLPPTDERRGAWLVRVLVNLCRDRGRRRSVRSRLRDRVPPPNPAAPDPEGAGVARATVEAALARLDPKRRAVVVLKELEELPTRRVARLLGMPQATVRWHLHRARRELAAFLQDSRTANGDTR